MARYGGDEHQHHGRDILGVRVKERFKRQEGQGNARKCVVEALNANDHCPVRKTVAEFKHTRADGLGDDMRFEARHVNTRRVDSNLAHVSTSGLDLNAFGGPLQAKQPRARCQELLRVVVGVEASQVRAENPTENLRSLREQPKDFRRREGGVQEKPNLGVPQPPPEHRR